MTPEEFSKNMENINELTIRRSDAIFEALQIWKITPDELNPDDTSGIAHAIQTLAATPRVPTENNHTAMEYLAMLLDVIHHENNILDSLERDPDKRRKISSDSITQFYFASDAIIVVAAVMASS
jgi:hypothetical protein